MGAELKKLRRLEQTPEYQAIKKELAALYSEKDKNADRIRALYKERNKLLKDNSFTEYGFTVDAKFYYKHFRTNIGSCVTVHCIAPQVGALLRNIFSGTESAFILNGQEKYIHCAVIRQRQAAVSRSYTAATILSGTNCIFR